MDHFRRSLDSRAGCPAGIKCPSCGLGPSSSAHGNRARRRRKTAMVRATRRTLRMELRALLA